jgi:hypothetical protein
MEEHGDFNSRDDFLRMFSKTYLIESIILRLPCTLNQGSCYRSLETNLLLQRNYRAAISDMINSCILNMLFKHFSYLF